MPKSTYPCGADLKARLTAAGIDPEILYHLDGDGTGYFDNPVAAAIDQWESETGWQPYLSAASQTVVMPAPTTMRGGNIVLAGRLVLSPAAFGLTSVLWNGRALAAGVDYRPGPTTGGVPGKPYTWIDFQNAGSAAYPAFPAMQYVGPLNASPNPPQISLTGRFGKTDQVPDDVWQAILNCAQISIAPEIHIAITEGVSETKIGDVTTRFASAGNAGPMDWPVRRWETTWERIVIREKRVTW